MISFSQAIAAVERYCVRNTAVIKPIEKSMGMVLAKDIASPINMPSYRQSSMDGYALVFGDDLSNKVIDEVQAGSSKNIPLKKGEAVRIFTGARVPDDADTIVIQEHVSKVEDSIHIEKMPPKNANIRSLGEQISKGDIALEKGTVLNEVSVAFLVGLGISKVSVYKKPKVSILVTGNELVRLGNELKEGQIFESNSVSLVLALKKIGVKNVKVHRVKDQLKSTTKAVKKCLKKSDIVLISGGISVGEYDFVKQALENNGVTEIFYKVNQRPGKPLWFGTKGNTKVFALPGNPVSSLSCFYLYVLPLIKAQLGFSNYHLERKTGVLKEDIINKTGKTLFLKGLLKDAQASVLDGQASSMLRSFAISNALLVVAENIDFIKKGEKIKYIELK